MAIDTINKFSKLLNLKRYSKNTIPQYTSVLHLYAVQLNLQFVNVQCFKFCKKSISLHPLLQEGICYLPRANCQSLIKVGRPKRIGNVW